MPKLARDHAFVVASALCLLAGVSAAEEPSAADRETARGLANEGRSHFSAQRYEEAAQRFRAAFAIMKVPTVGLDLARSEAALNHLVEARAVAGEVATMPVKQDEPPVFAEARRKATELAREVEGRIPSLVVRVTGAGQGSAELKVAVDGVLLPVSTLGFPRKTNPGAHVVVASARGFQPASEEVTLNEMETREVTLKLLPKVEVSPADAAGTSERPTASDAPASSSGGIPPWAWVSGTAGVIALGASIYFAVDYAIVRGEVAERCPGGSCDPRLSGDDGVAGLRSRWNMDLGMTVGFAVGGVGLLGAAVVGAVMSGREEPRASAQKKAVLEPWVSPGVLGAGVRGVF